MYFPAIVLPYQRLDSRWKTPELVFTHTSPLPPPGAAFRGAAFVFSTVTKGVSLSIRRSESPAFSRSSIESYGRPLMIFAAVTSPTPGSEMSSSSVALLRSTFSAGPSGFSRAGFSPDLPPPPFDFPTVTSGVSFSISLSPRPAFERSSIDAYGLPSMIFFAVAGQPHQLLGRRLVGVDLLPRRRGLVRLRRGRLLARLAAALLRLPDGHERRELLDQLVAESGLREVADRRVGPSVDDLLRRRLADAGQLHQLLGRRLVEVDLLPRGRGLVGGLGSLALLRPADL